jgi:carboxyl-terminal processing protease
MTSIDPSNDPSNAPTTPPFSQVPPTPPVWSGLAGPAPARPSRGPRSAFLAAVLVLTFGAGVSIGRISFAPADPSASAAPSAAPGDEFALIQQAWDAIHKNYVAAADLDDKALAYGAITGMTDAVGDTGHTVFMTPEERANRSSALDGSYVGIGVEVDTTPEGLPLVVGVFRGSPAEKAGIRAGDVMLAVDGKSTTGEDLDTIIGWVRGAVGTPVELTVRAGSDGPERTLKIVRADVSIEPVSWAMVPGTKTADVRLEQFSTGAAKKLQAALEEIKAAGAERLIFDLRGNPGGYVNEAVAVASEFLKSGTVYIERNAQGEEKASDVKPGGVATDIPLVVLVDGGTASAAEIVAGAIQDAGRAQIVGEKTFGTGTVLGEFPLSDGSALRIGTVEWLTPKGRVIWHEGIAPDVAVTRPVDATPVVPDDLRSMTAAQVAKLADPQVKKAIELVAKAS